MEHLYSPPEGWAAGVAVGQADDTGAGGACGGAHVRTHPGVAGEALRHGSLTGGDETKRVTPAVI